MPPCEVGQYIADCGGIGEFKSLHVPQMIFGRRTVAGSLIGGIQETQAMFDFCGEKNLNADIEVVAMQDIKDAYIRMQKSDVKYRFVIDMKT